MLQTIKLSLMKVLLVTAVSFSCSSLSSAAEWNYDVSDLEHGPLAWGNIEGFETCGMGMKQSPLDLTNAKEKGLTELKFTYPKTTLSVLNNGHTIQVNIDNGSEFKIGNASYQLLQFHFHTPSEHAEDGYRYPMEAHFVHVNTDGVLAVVGVFIKEGAHNPTLEKILRNSPHDEGDIVTNVEIHPAKLLAGGKEYFAYSGSLTTPPCSEGVRWHVLDDEIEASHQQLEQFAVLLHHNNARPLQELNNRHIYKRDD